MKRNNDSSREDAPDELDALFAARPVRPSADFASATLARIARERETPDAELDRLIANRPFVVTSGFADRVLAAVDAARRRRLIFRIVTPFAAAACLALAALPALRSGGYGASVTPADRVAATLAADPELRDLASLPTGRVADTRTRDLAAFAELDAALASSSTEYAYGI